MKTYLSLFALLAILLAGCSSPSGEAVTETEVLEVSEPVPDGLFIHVSSGYENPKKVLMALSLANKVKETRDVTLFFDIEGVKLLTGDAKLLEMPNYMPLSAALDSLTAAGVPIMACPMCMKAAGIDESMLRPGVTVATVDGFFGFTEGRILTLDY